MLPRGFRFEKLRSEMPRGYVFRICLKWGGVKLDPHLFNARNPETQPKTCNTREILKAYTKRG